MDVKCNRASIPPWTALRDFPGHARILSADKRTRRRSGSLHAFSDPRCPDPSPEQVRGPGRPTTSTQRDLLHPEIADLADIKLIGIAAVDGVGRAELLQ